MSAEPRFRILGHLDVEVGSERVEVGGRLKRALLADLLLHPNEVLAVDRLVDDLWGESPPSNPVNTLQVYVAQLRRLLEPERRSRQRPTVLVSDPPGYRIVVDHRSLDSLAFEDLARRGRDLRAQGVHDRAGELLRGALSLWRGAALTEFAESGFARGRLARLEEAKVIALEERLEIDLALGRHRDITAELQELTRRFPFRERLWELRMLALFRSSRSADALRTFQEAHRVLGDELGLAPGPALVELDRRIAAHDPSLAWAAPATGSSPRPRRAMTNDRLVGRQEELAVLERALQDAVAGTRAAVVITGEAGAGKSRLVAELAQRAWPDGCRVISGVCLEGASPPFAPVLEAVAEIVRTIDPTALESRATRAAAAVVSRLRPGLHDVFGPLPDPPQLPPDEDRTRLFDAVARLIVGATATAPIVLVLDDLQWADGSTIALARYVLRTAARAPILFVGCYRPGEVEPGSGLATALHALRQEVSAANVELHPLPVDAGTALVRDVLGVDADDGLVRDVVERAGGNPFFLRELAQETGIAGIPPRAREVVIHRIERLPEAARRLATAASVCDALFELSVAAAAAELSDVDALDALDTLMIHGVVVTSGDESCRFSHDIMREALYQHLSAPRRARLHRAVAEAMERWPEERRAVAAAAIARHYRLSAGLAGADRGADHADRAAGAAEAVHAYAEAADLLQLALDLLGDDDPRRSKLTARLGRALVATGAGELGVAALEKAAVAVGQAEGSTAAARLLADAASFAAAVGAFDAGYRLASVGLELAPEKGSSSWAILRLTEMLTGGLADPDWPGIVLGTPEQLEVAAALRELPRSSELLPTSLVLAFRSRSDVLATAPDDPAALAFWAGEYERALRLLPAVAQQNEDGGRLEMAIVLRCTEARCLNALGRFAEADVAFASACRLLGRLLRPSVYASHLLSAEEERWAALGEGWGALRVDISKAADQRWERWYSVVRRASEARVLARLGAADAARRRVESILGAVEAAPGWAENYVKIVYSAAEVLWLTGPSESARLLERNAIEKVLEPDFRYPMTDIRLALGRLAAVQGRLDEAREWFDRARSVLDAQAARPLLAVLDHDAGIVALRRGSPDEAAELLRSARQQAEALGMRGWAIAVERLQHGVEPG